MSVGMALLGNFTIGYMYLILLKKYGVSADLRFANKMFFYSQITKYIPGKIWGFWYQVTHIKKPTATTAVIFSNIDLTLAPIALISGISFGLLAVKTQPELATLSFLLAILGYVFVMRSCRVFVILSHPLRKLKKTKDNICVCSPMSPLIETALAGILLGIAYVFSYTLMLYSAFGIAPKIGLNYVGYLGVAWVVGILAVISPGGIGVREFVFILLARTIESDVSFQLLSAIAVFARLWIIMIDVSGAFLIKIITR